MTDTEEEGDPWIVAACPVTPELAARIVEFADRDWDDHEACERALAEAGWDTTGEDVGGFEEWAHSPAGHHVYGSGCFFMPFAYEYVLDPDEEARCEHWATLPGWKNIAQPSVDTFDGQLEAVVDQFTSLLGPPDHDVTHDSRPAFNHHWRYRVWRRGDNALVVAPGLDGFSYSQFEHLFVQIRPLPATAPLPDLDELPEFFTW
ncbi:hypothetical protein [Kitasatospora sp. NPDC101183]|uniref:hypothetical protein n=1 Tax=Kitasatospora sp. NPDC101183 TaxID=3364100 RepID=UPI0037F4536D